MAQLAANRAEDKFFSVLRDQREEFVRIEHSLALNAAASTDEAQRTSRAALERVYRAELGGIDDRFRVARSVIDSDPELANRYSDVLTRICNGWDDLKADWPAPQMAATVHEGLPRAFDQLLIEIGHDATTTTQMPTASLTDTLDQRVLEIGYVTVPPRASDNLRTMRPGTIMDFDAEFMDEIPSSENRAKILTWMNAHPKSLLGVADVEHQKIMAASPYRWRRVLSWLLIALVVVVVLVAAWFTHGWLDALGIANAPKGVSDRDYFFAVIASYAGAVAHTLVAALKQRQRTSSGSEPAFTALGNFAIWVHVNETYLMVYAFVIPAAAYAVMLLNGSVALATAFLVGYSIDSVLEVLLTRFDKFTSARTEIVANPSV